MAPPAPPPPAEWPKEAKDDYEPVRVLGKGGFASVMLAKKKGGNSNSFVAMKVVGPTENAPPSDLWKVYAHRELDILREVSHPNIMKVLQVWEADKNDKKNLMKPIVIALQYVKGPTIQDLLLHRGALNATGFGRVVIAQLIDAICYLHSRAVIHRDIKPDNVIVSGALSSQACIWEEDEDDGKKNWGELRKKWHVTLIDFGFARALTPGDVSRPSPEIRRENLDASYHAYNLDATMGSLNRSRHSGSSNVDLSSSEQKRKSFGRRRSSTASSVEMNRSFSRKFHRQMSALGNRQYAAPEILKVEHVPHQSHDRTSLTETVSDYVSEYGLLVDAYSLGHTIRYMMTGVPPHESVEEKIAFKKSAIYKVGKLFRKNSKNKVAKIYRLETELPGEVQRLISKLTERLESNRTSVRAARRYPWVEDVLPQLDPAETSSVLKQDISFLSLATTPNAGPAVEEPLPAKQ